jgi:F420-dependent oxidoreductase-like protein
MAQVGIMIEGQDGLNWERWKRILQTAEDVGYQCVFRSDHYTNKSGEDKDSLELWTSLTYAATHTKRIEFGPLVTPVTFRHPTMNVRYATAIDDLSDGRLVFGMGVGWQEREHTKFGVPFYDFSTRYKMLDEALQLVVRLLESDEPSDFAGEYFQLNDAILLPRPARAGGPPILIGGSGPKKTLPMVAKYADEWNSVGLNLETYKARKAILAGYLEEQGRPVDDIKYSMMNRIVYAPTQEKLNALLSEEEQDANTLRARGVIVGTGQEVVDQLGAWVDAGLERFMLQWFALDDMDRMESLAKDVLPHFHS